MTSRLHTELASLLPADFNWPIVLKAEKLDAYDLLDPKSKASKTVRGWLDELAPGALLVWRPPRRPWVVIVPAGEVEGQAFEYGMSFGAWRIVGLGEWVEAWPPNHRFSGGTIPPLRSLDSSSSQLFLITVAVFSDKAHLGFWRPGRAFSPKR